MQPKDLGPGEKWRVIPATDKQIQDTMEQINILGNDQLDEAMVHHFKEMIAYSYSALFYYHSTTIMLVLYLPAVSSLFFL